MSGTGLDPGIFLLRVQTLPKLVKKGGGGSHPMTLPQDLPLA